MGLRVVLNFSQLLIFSGRFALMCFFTVALCASSHAAPRLSISWKEVQPPRSKKRLVIHVDERSDARGVRSWRFLDELKKGSQLRGARLKDAIFFESFGLAYRPVLKRPRPTLFVQTEDDRVFILRHQTNPDVPKLYRVPGVTSFRFSAMEQIDPKQILLFSPIEGFIVISDGTSNPVFSERTQKALMHQIGRVSRIFKKKEARLFPAAEDSPVRHYFSVLSENGTFELAWSTDSNGVLHEESNVEVHKVSSEQTAETFPTTRTLEVHSNQERIVTRIGSIRQLWTNLGLLALKEENARTAPREKTLPPRYKVLPTTPFTTLDPEASIRPGDSRPLVIFRHPLGDETLGTKENPFRDGEEVRKLRELIAHIEITPPEVVSRQLSNSDIQRVSRESDHMFRIEFLQDPENTGSIWSNREDMYFDLSPLDQCGKDLE